MRRRFTQQGREAWFPQMIQMRAEGLSQLDIANVIGVNQSTIHYWFQIIDKGRTHWGYRPLREQWAAEETLSSQSP